MGAINRHNRRQRKKKHLGEFQEFGFQVDADISGPMNEADRDSFVDQFLLELIEANGLGFGGGINNTFSGYIVAMKANVKIDETHRELVRAWLERQSMLKNVVIGPLQDAWYN
ncbi:YggL family protein [Duganella sp. LX20W]|uniref:YggL family protein n=1 Tax=Rugamonas brunnea TaxID=2758569 RepID=A0A7W2EPA2_9BURK|nr:YggL family protein [Rugamonas brunnea]MBA5636066.1 YggL family protein [Rugamonas brunnea]